jgi:hypothetical protein
MWLLALLSSLFAVPSPEGLPKCGTDVVHCAPLRFFVTDRAPTSDLARDSGPDDAAFLMRQLHEANRLLGLAGIGFEVTSIEASAGPTEALTRQDRDTLGHSTWRNDQIDVHIVSRLADLDAPKSRPAEIRGVHWRSTSDRNRRYIILSRIAPDMVLAHELGHFFGLPHSAFPESIMNKRPRKSPDAHLRTFAKSEIKKMRDRAATMFKDGKFRQNGIF